jgi:ABC-type multidrug transport system permease subunit
MKNKSRILFYYFRNFLVGIIFLIGSILFNYTIGDNPKNLKMGIVNHEITSLQQCHDPKLVTSIFHNDTGICNLNMVSCRFLELLTKDDFTDLVWYDSYDEAFYASKRRHTIGFVAFSSNFSLSTQKLLEHGQHEDEVEAELLNNREINIQIDESEYFLTLFMRQKFYESYHNYTLSLLKDCNVSMRLNLSPIQFQDPIYGNKILDMKQYIGPVVTLVFYMFTSVAVTITVFIDEKQKGIWNRTFLCGVEIIEMLSAHIVFYTIVGAIHLFTFIPLMLWFYPTTRTIGLGLIVMYYFLFGLMGIVLGILGGAAFDDYQASMTFGSFFAFIFFFFSGKYFKYLNLSLYFYLNFFPRFCMAITSFI